MATATFRQGVAGYTSCEDTSCLAENETNYGDAPNVTLPFGQFDSGLGAYLIRFNDIPALGTITAVNITLTKTDGANISPGTNPAFTVEVVTKAWVESEATGVIYATGSSWGTPPCDFSGTSLCTVDPYTVASSGTISLDFNATGVAWVNANWQNQDNNGVALNCTGDAWKQMIVSSENDTEANRPILTLTYDPPTERARAQPGVSVVTQTGR